MLDSPLISNRAIPRRSIVAGLAMAALLSVTVAVAPFGSMPLPGLPGFVLAFAGVTLLGHLVTMAVLFSQARATKDHSAGCLGTAYMFSATAIVPYILVFPGVLPFQFIDVSPSLSLWLWCAWHFGFAALVIRAVLTDAAPRTKDYDSRRAFAIVLGVVGLVSALAYLAGPGLPDLVHGNQFTPAFMRLCGPLILVMNAAAFATVIVRLRGRTTMGVWLPVAMLTATLDVYMNLACGQRYALSWYVGKVFCIATSLIILMVLLSELAGVFHRLANANEELFEAAFLDHLTRLPNRALFTRRLALAFGRARSSAGFKYAVLFIDMDRFKLINDSLGHLAGDQLLTEVGERLKRCQRPCDTIARLGGDEFAMLIEGFDEDELPAKLAARLVGAMREPLFIGNQEVFPSCSIGVVAGDGEHEHPDDLLRDADIAMYHAKRHDSGQYAMFVPYMRNTLISALKLQTDLRHALSRKEFFIHFQPICDIATGRITALEALLRWHHPERGLVPPDVFIPAAEETGLIRDLGEWLLHEACAHMKTWRELPGASEIRLSVNTSGVELLTPGYVKTVKAALAATGLAPAALQLEVTEAVFLQNSEYVGTVLEDIRQLGVRIALDDFGTGYSSLGYLDRYPIDSVKIDRSFVMNMLTQRRTMAVVETVLRLGQALDLGIVAEGVETEAQRQALLALGCSSVQGYLLGTPMGVADVNEIIAEQPQRSMPISASMGEFGHARIRPRLVAPGAVKA